LYIRWQYQGHRCCPRKTTTQQKFDSNKSKNYTLQTAKKPGKSDFDSYVVNKSGTNDSREHRNKRCQKKRSKKDLEYQKKNGEKISFP